MLNKLGTVERRSLTSSAARAPETAERRINAALEKSCDFMLAVAAGNNNMYWRGVDVISTK